MSPIKKVRLLHQEQAVTPLTLGVNHRGFHGPYSEKFLKPLCFEHSFIEYIATRIHWYGDWDNFVALADLVIDKVRTEKNFSKELLSNEKEIGEKLNRLIGELPGDGVSGLAAADLVKYIKSLYQLGMDICGVGFVAVVPDLRHFKFSTLLKNIIKDKIEKENLTAGLNEYFSTLLTPTEDIIARRAKRELLLIASAAEKRGDKTVNNDDLLSYWGKYRWLDFGYLGPAHELDYYIDSVNDLLRSKNIQQEMRDFDAGRRELEDKRIRYERELKLDGEELSLFSAARDFMYSKQYRQEGLFKMFYALDSLLERAAKIAMTDKMSLHYCTLEELEDILTGGLDIVDLPIPARQEHCVCIFDGGGEFKVLIKDDAKKYLDERVEKEEVNVDITTVHGTAVYVGVVRGTVKIVNSANDTNKVQEGDILVSVQTTPEVLPAMKRAAAFVTDVGGITCHAAIVAREMKKPCIVGTKIATKVLKDGDLVEVNANKGDVIKLEK